MKKIISAILSVCMLLATGISVGADNSAISFSSDVRRFSLNGESMIDNIDPSCTVSQLISQINADSANLSVSDKNGAVSNDSTVCTGMKISLSSGGSVVDEVTAVIYGDVDGRSGINAADLLSLKRHLLGIEVKSGAFEAAANIKKSGSVAAADLLALKRHLLGLSIINQNGDTLTLKTVPALSENIRYTGRHQTIGTTVAFDYSYSGFEFNALCEGDVKATITSSGGWQAYGFLQVVVDGSYNVANLIKVNRGTYEYTLATGLARGTHKIQVYKQTEAQYNKFQLESLSIKGDMLVSPTAPSLKLEFYGDSITCAEGILGTGIAQADSQDAYRGYAGIVARNLGADVNCISASSWGLYRGRISPYENSVIPKIFEYSSGWRTPRENWDFSSYAADAVIINLGTNDAFGRSSAPFTDDEYKAAIADFTAKLRQKYPQAQIVWVYNMMTDALNTVTVDAVNDIRLTDSKVHAVKLTRNNQGLNGHPNLDGHATAAVELTSQLKQILNIAE